jgi:PGF-CTERM protein
MVGETRLTNTVQIKKAMIVTILSLLLLSVAGVGTATADPGSSYTGLTIVDASSDSVTIQGDTSCLRPDQPYRGDLPRGACNDESSGTPEIEAHLELVVIGEDGDEKRYANEPGFDVEEVESLYEEIDIEEYIEGYSADEEITIRIELWDYDPLSKGEDGNPEKITEDSAVINSQPGPLSDKDDDGIVYSNDECPNEPEDIDLDEDSDGCPESESTVEDTAVTFEDQTSEGDSVVVAESSHSDEYVVVVHADDDGAPGDIIGSGSDLEAGVNEDVTVELDETLGAGENTLHAMLHETSGDGEYGPPLSVDGDVVVESAKVTVEGEMDDGMDGNESEDDGMDSNESEGDGDGETEDGGGGDRQGEYGRVEGLPGFTAIVAVMALVGAAFMLARRDRNDD